MASTESRAASVPSLLRKATPRISHNPLGVSGIARLLNLAPYRLSSIIRAPSARANASGNRIREAVLHRGRIDPHEVLANGSPLATGRRVTAWPRPG